MESSARLFNCASCHQSVHICTECDRGNIYCSSVCSGIARRSALRQSSKRYQNSRIGKLKHAARQKRYRERKILIEKKVTDHTSQDTTLNDLLFGASETTKPMDMGELHCDFCGKICSTFVRMGFLRRHSPILPIWLNSP